MNRRKLNNQFKQNTEPVIQTENKSCVAWSLNNQNGFKLIDKATTTDKSYFKNENDKFSEFDRSLK